MSQRSIKEAPRENCQIEHSLPLNSCTQNGRSDPLAGLSELQKASYELDSGQQTNQEIFPFNFSHEEFFKLVHFSENNTMRPANSSESDPSQSNWRFFARKREVKTEQKWHAMMLANQEPAITSYQVRAKGLCRLVTYHLSVQPASGPLKHSRNLKLQKERQLRYRINEQKSILEIQAAVELLPSDDMVVIRGVEGNRVSDHNNSDDAASGEIKLK